ncbi:MAG: hypothetical protein ACJ8AO_11180 [Gemmatimonadaceae bacterium]
MQLFSPQGRRVGRWLRLWGPVLAFLLFGWPTPYRYIASAHLGNRVVTVRVNRVTGSAAVLTAAGWRPLVRP